MNKLWIATALGALVVSTDLVAQEGGEGGRRGGGRRGFDPAATMERLDKNKDGKLTKEEVGNDRMWERFAAADKDKDGNITAAELAEMPRQQGGRRRGGEGGEGGEGRARGGRGMNPAAMMERLDKNKDGKLTKEEVGNDRMWDRLAAADKDKDGNITAAELEAMPRPQRGEGRGEGGDGQGRRGGRRGERPAGGEPAPKPDGGEPKPESKPAGGEPKPAGGGGEPKPAGGGGGGGN